LEAIDLSQLCNVTLNDRELMREVVGALVRDASSQVEDLSLAIERADAAECGRLAHGLSGACGNVGAFALAALFNAVEREAAAGGVSRCGRHLERLRAELDKLRRAAEAI
jgi:HPt (histidine-containing phosphotransfer) domain-containing protein